MDENRRRKERRGNWEACVRCRDGKMTRGLGPPVARPSLRPDFTSRPFVACGRARNKNKNNCKGGLQQSCHESKKTKKIEPARLDKAQPESSGRALIFWASFCSAQAKKCRVWPEPEPQFSAHEQAQLDLLTLLVRSDDFSPNPYPLIINIRSLPNLLKIFYILS